MTFSRSVQFFGKIESIISKSTSPQGDCVAVVMQTITCKFPICLSKLQHQGLRTVPFYCGEKHCRLCVFTVQRLTEGLGWFVPPTCFLKIDCIFWVDFLVLSHLCFNIFYIVWNSLLPATHRPKLYIHLVRIDSDVWWMASKCIKVDEKKQFIQTCLWPNDVSQHHNFFCKTCFHQGRIQVFGLIFVDWIDGREWEPCTSFFYSVLHK